VLSIVENYEKILIKDKVSSPLAIALLDYLLTKPIISVQGVASHFQTSYQTALVLIKEFTKREILREMTEKKRDRRYSYWEYMDSS
jgi:Fic family protein